MVFQYPVQPHRRKHGPMGYVDYTSFKDWLRDEFAFRCVYCLVREQWSPVGLASFAVEHHKPKSLPEYQALLCVYENLVYACSRCNSFKLQHVVLDPCTVAFGDHLRVHPDGQIEGLTPEGKNLIAKIRLQDPLVRQIRVQYLTLESLYLQQPDNLKVRLLYHDAFGFPDDLPNLAALRPPDNSRPEGLADCYYQQRAEGRLPSVY